MSRDVRAQDRRCAWFTQPEDPCTDLRGIPDCGSFRQRVHSRLQVLCAGRRHRSGPLRVI